MVNVRFNRDWSADLKNPFSNVLRLTAGDFLAKSLTFLAFIYLARKLGVGTFGVLEYANSLLTWFLLLADGGLELWATREAAQSPDLRKLAGRVLPLRLCMAGLSFALTLLFVISPLQLFVDFPGLRLLTVLFGLSLFAQAASLKWLWMGREKMSRVAGGLIVSQIVFALAVFAFVQTPAAVVWVPIFRLVSDAAMAAYFAMLFVRENGNLNLPFTLQESSEILRPAFTIGTSQAMGLLNYNFDTLVLGFLKGASVVGWYNAAYKPVTVILAVPLTYFQGMFPAFSRAWTEDKEAFLPLVTKSFSLCAIFAIPLGVGGTYLAEPIIQFLFGTTYLNSAAPFRILVWSAVFVILRGSCRHALNAAGKQTLDLRCAIVSAGLNVGLNLLLIPQYGMIGSATATVIADIVWFVLACYFFTRAVSPLGLVSILVRPTIAAFAMAGIFELTAPGGFTPWFVPEGMIMGIRFHLSTIPQSAIATGTYFLTLFLLREPGVLGFFKKTQTT